MNNRLLFIIIFLIGILGGFFLLKSSSRRTDNTKLQVNTSFYPLFFFASEIGNDKSEVSNITPPGSEPHAYDPTSQDIAKIERGSMLVLNGSVEAWATKVQENLQGTKVRIVIAGEGLFSQTIEEEGENQTDPHIWLDPLRAKKEVENITQGYSTIDPTNTSYYQSNQKKLAERLDQLDEKFRKGLENCQQKDFITSHAAFGYLATRYGLRQVPISGLSPDAEPSAKQLTEITDFAKKNNVKYIFFESLVNPKLSDTIANEVGAKTLILDPLEGISDNDRQQGKNYFTVMEENLKNLQIALSCSN
ncbi:metal ABC transporter substrate-binding protein [soil metagenome]